LRSVEGCAYSGTFTLADKNAMQFSIKDAIPFPREQVFSAQRDQMPDLVTYLNDIESITVQEHEQDGHITKLVNLWVAGGADIPAAARSFVKPEMLRWTDYATWDEEKWQCEWNLVLGFLQEAVSVSGTTSFAESNDRTTVTIAGDITIKADKIPGVPRFMAKKIGPIVEKFVIGLIKPNLKKTSEGIGNYLRDQA
jgi:uncharacterized protein YndB with AHSA1/START domain